MATFEPNPIALAMQPFARQFTGNPFVPATLLGPPSPATQINAAYSMPTGTITDANRAEFATISASAEVAEDFTIRGFTSVGIPTLKGTFFFDQLGGGSSQSFYAVDGAPGAPTNFASMLNAMKQLATVRSGLSQCNDTTQCVNPLLFSAIRIDDVRTKRKGQTIINPQLSLASYRRPGGAGATSVNFQNDQTDACYKVTFSDDVGNAANMYFHGVPIDSQLSDTPGELPVRNFEARFPDIEPRWITALNAFTNRLRELGLGVRYTTVQWTPGGNPVFTPSGNIIATGNGTPIAVEYGKTGTGPQTYTFQMPVGSGNVLGKFRVIMREFKGLRILNGRHPAMGFNAGGNYYVNVRMNAPNYLPFDGYGYLSPEVFGTFQPSPAPPVSQANFSGVSGAIYTTHKVGRPFGQARGRRSPVVR